MASKTSPFAVLGKFWQNAGLSWLLADSPERRRELTARTSGVQPEPKTAAKPPEEAKTPVKAPASAPQKTGFPPLPVLNRADWPQGWLALLDRRKLPDRPKTVWTYPGLEQDLLGQPDPLRQRLVAGLIKDLNHPGGTHVFWPYQLETEKNPASLFWSWETIFRPRALLVFGEQASLALNLPLNFHLFTSHDYQGRQIVFLPEPAKLAADQAMYASVLALLARLLSFCKR